MAFTDARVEACTYEALAQSEPPIALWVAYIDRDRAGAQIAALSGAPIVAVVEPAAGSLAAGSLAAGSLASDLAVWALSEQIVAVVAEAALEQVIARVLADEPRGLAGIVTASHTRTIRDHDDKLACIAALGAATEALPAKLRQHIEQCADELVMNALYAAPIGTDGRPVFAGIPVRRRIALRTYAEVTVRYGSDPARFAITVRDNFGSLDRATLLRVLHKGVHAEEAVDRRAGGAGLGLFLLVNAATALYVDVVPGVACEVTCVFEQAAPARAALAFVQHAVGEHPRALPARAFRSAGARRKLVRNAVLATTALACALLAVTNGFASRPSIAITGTPGTAIELDGRAAGTLGNETFWVADESQTHHLVIARKAGHTSVRREITTPAIADITLAPVATVELESQPAGAIVELAGARLGTTPLVLTTLPQSTHVELTLVAPGYARATVPVAVPAGGNRLHLSQALVRATGVVRLQLASNPPGARVVRAGEPLGAEATFTPADLFIAANTVHRFEIAMPGEESQIVEIDAKAEDLARTVELVPKGP